MQNLLGAITRGILKKYQPLLIGVTGSVGKTATRDAIVAVLRKNFHVAEPLKNYNNEFGLPLTVLGMYSPGKSPFGWVRVFARATRLRYFSTADFPTAFVLEMGVDRKGDMAYLTSIAPCTIGVFTALGHAHADFFGSPEGILQEKESLITQLPEEGTAVLNADDPDVIGIAKRTRAHIRSFGFTPEAEVRTESIALVQNEEKHWPEGIVVSVVHGNDRTPIEIQGVIGSHQAMPALAAVAVGLSVGMELHSIAKALQSYQPPAGRMRLLPGIKGTLLIDDSYNASPTAMLAAVEALFSIPVPGRRIAVLGSMAELGTVSEESHAAVGSLVAQRGVDLLVTVGENARKIASVAQEHGMHHERIVSFNFSPEAALYVQGQLQTGDAVLMKGSQSMRMEKVAKELLAVPERASELLVRQGNEWK